MPKYPCWRVAVNFYRRDQNGVVRLVERFGPVIQAPSEMDAIDKAEFIFSGSMDYASVGRAEKLHVGHRGEVIPRGANEQRPSTPPSMSLDESLAVMAAYIRNRRRR